MKAIRVHKFGGPEVLILEEVSDPKPGPGQVVVRVKAVGVNPVDTYIRAGNYAQLPTPPYTPGGDAAGVVEALGAGVTGVAPGERVYITGTTVTPGQSGAYAERALCEAGQVKPLPASVSFAQGAAVNVPYATAWRALYDKAHAQPGEVVLVHGASGGVGVAAVQIARAAGLTVIGTAGSAAGLRMVAEQGAHHALDHTKPGYDKAVLELTGGAGADVILENLANVNLARDLDLVARFGRIVVIGNRGTIEINPRGAMLKDATIVGFVLWNASAGELGRIHAALGAGLASGTLRPVVGQEFPLAEAGRAHEAVMAPGHQGKVVLLP